MPKAWKENRRSTGKILTPPKGNAPSWIESGVGIWLCRRELWEGGFIYDPRDGKTYKCKITMESPDQLEGQGFYRNFLNWQNQYLEPGKIASRGAPERLLLLPGRGVSFFFVSWGKMKNLQLFTLASRARVPACRAVRCALSSARS